MDVSRIGSAKTGEQTLISTLGAIVAVISIMIWQSCHLISGRIYELKPTAVRNEAERTPRHVSNWQLTYQSSAIGGH
jgi:hypothetical protein